MIIVSILQHDVDVTNVTHFRAIRCDLYSAANKFSGEYKLNDLDRVTDVCFKGRLESARTRKYMMMMGCTCSGVAIYTSAATFSTGLQIDFHKPLRAY